MLEANFTSETAKVFQYIKDKLIKEYPTDNISIDYFFLSVLENTDSVAYKILSKTTITSTLDSIHRWFKDMMSKVHNSNTGVTTIKYDVLYDRAIEKSKKDYGSDEINSGHLLLSILKINDTIAAPFKEVGITHSQLLTNLNSMFPQKENRKGNNFTVKMQVTKGAVEEMLINMNEQAANGKIDDVIGNDDVIRQIFNILTKRDRNNVIIVGDSGIGKTATVSHIANLLVDGKVPKPFRNKKLMKLDFMSLVSGAALRGNFETKFNAIVTDAVKKNGYIFFLDDIQSVLSENSKFSEISTDNILDPILSERNIGFICTSTEKFYNTYIASRPSLKRRFQKIVMHEKDDSELRTIINVCKRKYENYHNVSIDENVVETCIKLIRRYAKDAKLPDYALDILDEAAAMKTIDVVEDERVVRCNARLSEIGEKLGMLSGSTDSGSDEEFEELKKEEISVKSELSQIEKEKAFKNTVNVVTEDDIRELISVKTNIPVTALTTDEVSKLKSLADRLKKSVIGQDEAVDEVCRIVKRQRIGMSSKNRPSVLFFSGSTGTGKTYLAKKLAEEVFGSEKDMVRLDMSEYSDKMSVNKLYGAASGYIGYDKGGILTEAIKKNNHCVLLLDEMEKANEDVHNVFLQLFDEGRLTDNMGNIVDFSNVIVIMTSNVGAKDISEKGKGIGFIKDTDTENREIIEKAMKRVFKPEFINRIDCIVHFNRLSEDNLKHIIKTELDKLADKLKSIDYKLGETFLDDDCIAYLYNKVSDKPEYGARPVIYTIQREIEDKITDYIIENQPVKGFVFETSDIPLVFD